MIATRVSPTVWGGIEGGMGGGGTHRLDSGVAVSQKQAEGSLTEGKQALHGKVLCQTLMEELFRSCTMRASHCGSCHGLTH